MTEDALRSVLVHAHLSPAVRARADAALKMRQI